VPHPTTPDSRWRRQPPSPGLYPPSGGFLASGAGCAHMRNELPASRTRTVAQGSGSADFHDRRRDPAR